MAQTRYYRDQIDQYEQTGFVGCKDRSEAVNPVFDFSAPHLSPVLTGIGKSLFGTFRCLLLSVRNIKTALWRIIKRSLLAHQDFLLTFEIRHLATNSIYLTVTKVRFCHLHL